VPDAHGTGETCGLPHEKPAVHVVQTPTPLSAYEPLTQATGSDAAEQLKPAGHGKHDVAPGPLYWVGAEHADGTPVVVAHAEPMGQSVQADAPAAE
jgi:hypothetical protein